MKPFLYLDNWHARQPTTRFDTALQATGMDVVVKRTNDGEIPDHTDYCGVYVSPSFNGAYDDEGWIHQEHDVLRDMASVNAPMLGLCFGSQILASALCGPDQVFVRDEREKGYGEIRLTEEARTSDPVTKGLPDVVPVFHWHGDEVRAGHPDIKVLAYSDRCENQIWRWRNGPVWGVQPHPEFDREQVISWFKRNREEFEKASMDYDALVANVDDNEIAGRMITNFLHYVINKAKA